MIDMKTVVFDHQNSLNSDDTSQSSQDIIRALNDDKIQLLNDKRKLFQELENKNNEIIRINNYHKSKWEKMHKYMQTVEVILNELEINDTRLDALRIPSDDGNSANVLEKRSLNSSLFTETHDNYSISSESIVADKGANTLQNTPKIVASSTGESLNSISGYKSMENSSHQYLEQLDSSDYRPHSHCLSKEDSTLNRSSKMDSAASVPEFKIPDEPSPPPGVGGGLKKLFKKSSIVRSNKALQDSPHSSNIKLTQSASIPVPEFVDLNNNKLLADYSIQELYDWLRDYVRLPKILLENIRHNDKLALTSSSLVVLATSAANQYASNKNNSDPYPPIMLTQKYDKLLGIRDKLISMKLGICFCFSNITATANQTVPDLSDKDNLWVTQTWLPQHLGLAHLSSHFQSRCMDGRSLIGLAKSNKDLIQLSCSNFDKLCGFGASPQGVNTNNSNGMNTSDLYGGVSKSSEVAGKFELKSIRYGLMLLEKFEFDLTELENRRAACENTNTDLIVWTNERLAKWLEQINLKIYTRGIEYSGLHGAVIVLDPEFTPGKLWKLLEVPIETVKKYGLEEKLEQLMKPSRISEGLKPKRSHSFFPRRSFSQPRRQNPTSKSSEKPQSQTKFSTKTPQEIGATTATSSDFSVPQTGQRGHQTVSIQRSYNANFREKSKTLESRSSNNHHNSGYTKSSTVHKQSQPLSSNFVRHIRPIGSATHRGMSHSQQPIGIEKEPSEISLGDSIKNSNSSLNTYTLNNNGRHYVKSPPPKLSLNHTSNQMISRKKKQQQQNQQFQPNVLNHNSDSDELNEDFSS